MRAFHPSSGFLMALIFLAGCTAQPDVASQGATALSADDRAEAAETLVAWESEWAAAFVSKDFGVLDRILAPDFIYTLDTGDVVEKGAFIESARNDPDTFTRFDLSDMEARWYSDDVVVITGASSTEVRDVEGNVVRGNARWTNVFLQRDGQWQCAVGHGSEVEEG